MTQEPLTTTPSAGPTMIRSEERLDVRTERVEAQRVSVRRRIVTEERIVRVQVRREELVLDTVAGDGVAVTGEFPDRSEPLVLVLRQEVPDVVLRTEAYEQVTITKQSVTENQQVQAELRHEVVELERDAAAPR